MTQINAGRDTPGVDMLVVKTPKARSELVDQIRSYQPWKAKPARRVYIPKGRKEVAKKRPLGIPTVHDRAMQAIVKNALEPYWEARFEPASYGFRPGRGCHDAIAKIFSIARPNKRKKWVLDADIEGAFDSISHEKVLEPIGPFPARELIRQWLKAGYVEMGTLHRSETGAPQGGVIGPLLMNIALHGMEDASKVRHDKRGQTAKTEPTAQGMDSGSRESPARPSSVSRLRLRLVIDNLTGCGSGGGFGSKVGSCSSDTLLP